MAGITMEKKYAECKRIAKILAKELKKGNILIDPNGEVITTDEKFIFEEEGQKWFIATTTGSCTSVWCGVSTEDESIWAYPSISYFRKFEVFEKRKIA